MACACAPLETPNPTQIVDMLRDAVENSMSSIEKLLDEPHLANSMGDSARRWVVEHADVDRYADRLLHELESLRASR